MIPTRDILILLVIAIISSSITRGLSNGTNPEALHTTRLLVEESPLTFGAVQHISIQRNGELLEFEYVMDQWWQVVPFYLRMDSASMRALIRAVQGAQVLGELTDTTNVSAVGLGDESNMIRLSDGEHELTVHLGRKTLGGRAYAQLGESKPVVVDQSMHRRAIDADDKLWRDIRLFPYFSIDGISIERDINGERLVLEQVGGMWVMREPVSTRVDQAMLREWVGRLAAARVQSFVLDDPSDLAMFGLHAPVATFTVVDRIGTTHKMFVGGRVSAGSQDRYVMFEDRPVVCKVSWATLSPLFPSAEVFVDATGSAVSRFDIKQLTIRIGNTELVVKRDLQRWVDSNGVQADNESIEALLTWILDTKPPRVAIGNYPKQDEFATVVLSGYDLMPLDTVRIAVHQDGQWIIENGDNVLRLHHAEAGDVLDPFNK